MMPFFGGDRTLVIAPGVVRAPLTLTRSQAAGARSTSEVLVPPLVLIAAGEFSPLLTIARAQASGDKSTSEVRA